MAGRKVFAPKTVLTAADVNSYLMDQTVPRFPDAATRDSQWPSPPLGARCNVGNVPQYFGSGGWVNWPLAVSIHFHADLVAGGNKFDIGSNLPVAPCNGLWFCHASAYIWQSGASQDVQLAVYTDSYASPQPPNYGWNVYGKPGNNSLGGSAAPGKSAMTTIDQGIWIPMGSVTIAAQTAAGGRASINVSCNALVTGQYSFDGQAECQFYPGATHASISIGPS